jgi:4-hydroxy-tetrahydrodipicolinate synthase
MSTQNRLDLSGVHTAIITPFRDGKVDHAALEALVERQIAGGVHGLVPCGTTGESATLSKVEKVEIFRRVIATAKGRAKVIAGVGTNDTAGSIELARAAADLGADAGLVITPYYNKPTAEGMYQHFRTIAEAVPARCRACSTTCPARTSVSLDVATRSSRLADVPGIVAIKEATSNLVFDAEILARCGERLAVLSGDDAVAFPLWCLGGRGVICVASNVAPERMVALWHAFEKGDLARARKLHLSLLPLLTGLFIETNPGPVKALYSWMYPDTSPEMRLPLVGLQPGSAARLRKLATDLELLTERA